MDLKQLRGVDEKRAKDFKKLGITNTADLARYFPRGYLDMTSPKSVRELIHNDTALVACRLTAVEPVRYTGRVKIFRAKLEQNGEPFFAVWFNMP